MIERRPGRMIAGMTAGAALAFALVVLDAAAARAADGLADGEYDCGGGYTYRAMGKVDIQGGQFRYRPYGDPVNAYAPYAMDASGVIHWGGPLGGLDDPPARLGASTLQSFGFNVEYQGKADGLVQTMSCHAPGK